MKEAYVKFETAQLLKEKGFDWECTSYWCVFQNGDTVHTDVGNLANHNGNETNKFISRPTQQMACRWLRKEKGIHILPEISEVKENPKYYCMIWKTSTLESFIIELFDSYEDAIEAALEYVLTNLI